MSSCSPCAASGTVIRVAETAGPMIMLAAVAPNEDRPDETIEPA